MRNLIEVIDQMIAVIPETDEEGSFIAALRSNKSSAMYAAPEAVPMWWREVSATLNYFLGQEIDPEWEDWQFQVASIWSTTPVATLRKNSENV